MRNVILMAALLLPATALAIPCPKGSNVRLSDKTSSSKVKALKSATSASNTTKSVSLKNHYPH